VSCEHFPIEPNKERAVSRYPELNRRDALRVAGACLTAGGLDAVSASLARAGDAQSVPIKKAVKIGMVAGKRPLVEKFKLLKSLGFDGVEMDSPNSLSRDEVLRARDEAELPIHGVVDSMHWRETLSHPIPAVRQRGLEGLKTALRDSKEYGGTTVLLVPAVVNAEVSYDEAYERSQQEIRKALPLAENLGIKICFENVWNQFLLSPLETARYIDEFDSPFVGAYFDVGNVVNYGWPEQWIRILGKRIVKLDIKEYSRKRRDAEGPYRGFDVELGEGDCNWPAVMAALREIEYTGWGTAEVPGGDEARLRDIARRMDACFAA